MPQSCLYSVCSLRMYLQTYTLWFGYLGCCHYVIMYSLYKYTVLMNFCSSFLHNDEALNIHIVTLENIFSNNIPFPMQLLRKYWIACIIFLAFTMITVTLAHVKYVLVTVAITIGRQSYWFSGCYSLQLLCEWWQSTMFQELKYDVSII